MAMTSATCSRDTGRFVIGHEHKALQVVKRHHYDCDFAEAVQRSVESTAATNDNSFELEVYAT